MNENYQTISITFEGPVCFLKIDRPHANNTINDALAEEFEHFLKTYSQRIHVLVLEGLPDVFCFGADFEAVKQSISNGKGKGPNPDALYYSWLQLATGPFISIAHVRGKANAGGIGFVAACDIVLADKHAVFSLSELLFGLFPACVLPFLVRRIGFQKSNYMTLMTQPVSAEKAELWGLVDGCDNDSSNLLRTHLLRLKCLSKAAISEYKSYMNDLDDTLICNKSKALAANLAVFSNSTNLDNIFQYVESGKFPWDD